VESIRQTSVKQAWTPLGMGVGVSPGQASGQATTSFQIGPGFSNQGMVILGAGGGAAYRKSPNAYEQPRWEVTVKLDNGQKRVVTLAYEPFVREGDRVRIAGNNLELVE
jgi:outer membrane lipoprotein SlyB